MHISFYNQNSAKNALLVEVNFVSFYFSYNTLVWVHIPYDYNSSKPPHQFNGTYVIKNQWGPTTWKHLNWIDGGTRPQDRLDQKEFDKVVKYAMKVARIKKPPSISII